MPTPREIAEYESNKRRRKFRSKLRALTSSGGGSSAFLQQQMAIFGGLDFLVSDLSSGAVTSFLSHEGLLHNASQGTGAAKPTKGATGLVFDGGDSLVRLSAINNLKFVHAATLPDGLGSDSGKGFAGTGLCRVPGTTDEFLGVNHGQNLPADPTWTPSIVRFRRNADKTLTFISEIDLQALYGPGATSFQGITIKKTDNTILVVDLAANVVRNLTLAGVDIPGGALTSPFLGLNGIAYTTAAQNAVWVCQDGAAGNNIAKISCVDSSVIVASTATGLTNVDQLNFNEAVSCLLLTHGANGTAGKVRVYNVAGVTTLVSSGDMALPIQVDCVEAILWDGGPTFLAFTDSFFHSGASGLNQLVECLGVPPLTNELTLYGKGFISATTGTDCIIENGAPLGGGNGWGMYPTSVTGMNVFANTGASGVGQQGSIIATGLPSMAVIPRTWIVHLDGPNDLGTLYWDGVSVQTGSLANLVGGMTTAQTLRFSDASDIARPITGTIVTRIGFICDLVDVNQLNSAIL